MNDVSTGTAEKLKFCIYRLIDPRNGETLYVGKGKGNRLFHHVNATRASDLAVDPGEGELAVEEDDVSLKVKRINDIRREGLEVIHIIHRHGIVRGVFVAERWLPAIPEHFPPLRFGETSSSRMGFHGRKAPDEVWMHFVGARGKRLPEEFRPKGQNPIRYIGF